MIKKLFLLFLLFNLKGLAQEWVNYDLDSVITLDMPSGYTVQDTIGHKVVTGHIPNAMVVIDYFPVSEKDQRTIRDRTSLREMYSGFGRGIVEETKGELVDLKFAEQNGLMLMQYSFKAVYGEEHQVKHCIAAYIKGKVYSVLFIELISKSRELTPARTKFFNSIKLNKNLKPEDQVDPMRKNIFFKLGYALGGLAVLLVLGLIVLGIVFLIKRQVK
jgi:hypothetical protein